MAQSRKRTGGLNFERKATIRELIRFIWPLRPRETAVPWWPPDVYAVTATILRRTGSYVRVMELPCAGRESFYDKSWPQEVGRIASSWRDALNVFIEERDHELFRSSIGSSPLPSAKAVAPPEVRQKWRELLDFGHLPISDITLQDTEPTRVLLMLCCIADEACGGLGLRAKSQDRFIALAEWVLEQQGRRTACIAIPRDRIAVLPKQHTPQRGLTLRSLSHNLSLHPATEVIPKWRAPAPGKERELINLLLLPWPTETSAADFKIVDSGQGDIPWTPESARFFSYERQEPVMTDFPARLQRTLDLACKHAEEIHAIVFPELALSVDEFLVAERFAFDHRALLIAGVRIRDGELGYERSCNTWIFQTAGLLETAADIPREDLEGFRVSQVKHHRWCLDRNQILQYGLGGRLPASKDCWELMDVVSREVEFFTIDSWLTWSVLICEDLARQDPVAEVIRAVGPNMVIALLMDGPQLKERWPSRYASVLAEDPGCSVLTLTTLGMSRRTQSANRDRDRSNVIGLWRDVSYGARELELQKGDDACVLSLVCKTNVEYTADGRTDGGSAHFPVFAGMHSFNTSIECNSPGRRPDV